MVFFCADQVCAHENIHNFELLSGFFCDVLYTKIEGKFYVDEHS